MIVPPPHKKAWYNPDLIPAAISVDSENSISNLTTPSDSPDILPTHDPTSIHVLKKDVILKGVVNRGYFCSKHGRIRCYKNTRLYFSTWSDQDNRFYYCHGFSMISSETRTCFLEHQYSTSQCFGWLLCLYPFYPLFYLLNLFCAYSLPVPLITTFNIPYFCSDWLFDLVLFLLNV